MKKDFEKRETALFTKWEKAKGIRIPEAVREKWKEAVGLMDGEDEIALKDLDGYIEDGLDVLEYLATANYFSNRKKPKGSTPKKRYQRCFEKELYIVTFVIGKRKPYIFDVTETFISRQRIDWTQLCDEWNKAHPFDRMNFEVLKVRYYRAIAKEDIRNAYIRSRFKEIPLDRETLIKAIEDSKNEPLYIAEHLLQSYSLLGYRNLKILGKEAQNERTHSQEG